MIRLLAKIDGSSWRTGNARGEGAPYAARCPCNSRLYAFGSRVSSFAGYRKSRGMEMSRRGRVEVQVLSPRIADEKGSIRKLNEKERAVYLAAAYRTETEDKEGCTTKITSTSQEERKHFASGDIT